MSLGIVTFTNEDRVVLLKLILILIILSFLLQIIGLSTSAWICEDSSVHCKGIYELDGRLKGLLISSFTLKCLACLWLISFCYYKLKYNRDHAWSYCMERHGVKWRLWVMGVIISEMLSGTVFILMCLQYDGMSWSAYLYSFTSFLLVVLASTVTAIRLIWCFLKLLEPRDINNYIQQRDDDTWHPRNDTMSRPSPPLLGNSSSSRRSSRSEQNRRTEECAVCMERPVNILLPCSHMLCRACATRIHAENSLCPFDRQYFSDFVTLSRV